MREIWGKKKIGGKRRSLFLLGCQRVGKNWRQQIGYWLWGVVVRELAE